MSDRELIDRLVDALRSVNALALSYCGDGVTEITTPPEVLAACRVLALADVHVRAVNPVEVPSLAHEDDPLDADIVRFFDSVERIADGLGGIADSINRMSDSLVADKPRRS